MQWRMFAAGAVFLAIGGTGMYTEHADAQQAEAAQYREQAAGNRAALLPTTPSELLRSMYYMVGEGRADEACVVFDPSARDAITASTGKSCPEAVLALSDLVTDRRRYGDDLHYDYAQAIRVAGETGTVDACAVTWQGFLGGPSGPDPGPKLGRWTVAKRTGTYGSGWAITSVTPCPATPSSVAPTTSPGTPNTPGSTAPPAPPSTTRPGVLPSYAPGFAGLMAGRIAQGDTDACTELMSDTGRAQFAVAFGAGDCAAAITALHNRVTDPDRYGQPDPTTVTTTETPGRATVNACRLRWSTFLTKTPPGPQIGVLDLAKPEGNTGYLIVGFRHC